MKKKKAKKRKQIYSINIKLCATILYQEACTKLKIYKTATIFFMRRKLPFPLVCTRINCVQPTRKLNCFNYWYLFVDLFLSSHSIHVIKMIIFHVKIRIYGENMEFKYTREGLFLLLLHFIFTIF